MDTVTMQHPNLPQTITVPASAVPHHQASGWEPVDDSAPAPAARAPQAAPAAEQTLPEAAPDPKPARRRREPKEGE